MSSFAIGLKRGKRRRAGVGVGLARPQSAAGFGGGEDSDDEKPRVKSVTRIVSAAKDEQEHKLDHNHHSKVTGGEPKKEDVQDEAPKKKTSQIARLVERRRDAERRLLDKRSGEGRDELLFHYDVESCPEQVALATYEKTPVDGFGAAMLRSMGWKGNAEKGSNGAKEEDEWLPKLRPARLGLGAKLGQELTKVAGQSNVTVKNGGHVGEEGLEKDILKGTQSEDEVFEDHTHRLHPTQKVDNPAKRDAARDGKLEKSERTIEDRPRKRSRFASNDRRRKDWAHEESRNMKR